MYQTFSEAAGRDARRASRPAESREFHGMLVEMLPRLRGYAFSLARNRAEADDLVQDAVALALRGRDRFEPGTDFSAWMHRIVRNRFLCSMRQRRRRLELDGLAAGSAGQAGPPQNDRLVLEEATLMLGRLPAALREALVLVAVEGSSYDQVAAAQGCAAGTAKSRVFRARYLLQLWLAGGSTASDPVGIADTRPAAMSRTVAMTDKAHPATRPGPPVASHANIA